MGFRSGGVNLLLGMSGIARVNLSQESSVGQGQGQGQSKPVSRGLLNGIIVSSVFIIVLFFFFSRRNRA